MAARNANRGAESRSRPSRDCRAWWALEPYASPDNGVTKLSFFAVLLPLATSAWAQPIPRFYQPLEQVKQFLQLTDSQVQTILTTNEEYNRFAQAAGVMAFPSTRAYADRCVQACVAGTREADTDVASSGRNRRRNRKGNVGPERFGIRYAEIESICRELNVRASQNRTRNLDALNPDQKTKLKALEDAIKSAPVILEAQFGNMIAGYTSAPYAFTSESASFGTVIGGVIGGVGGCYSPVSILPIRSGDFGGAPFSGNRIPASRLTGAPQLQVNLTAHP